MTKRLSVIVPLAAGESAWAALVADLVTHLPPGSEVVAVGAGFEPETPIGWPDHLPLRRIASSPGRAVQMNAGAVEATGRWLWFLHADTHLSSNSVPALVAFLTKGEDALGWFDLAFLPDGPKWTRLNAWGANLRSRWLGIPFGDQGFVIPRQRFATLGGYDERAAFGEDHLLLWAARRDQLPLRRIRAILFTSARKYARDGWRATTSRHVRLTVLQAWEGWRANRTSAT